MNDLELLSGRLYIGSVIWGTQTTLTWDPCILLCLPVFRKVANPSGYSTAYEERSSRMTTTSIHCTRYRAEVGTRGCFADIMYRSGGRFRKVSVIQVCQRWSLPDSTPGELSRKNDQDNPWVQHPPPLSDAWPVKA